MLAGTEHGRNKNGRKNQVLVVDDEPQVLVAIEDALSDDYDVLTATSPLLALRLLEHEKDIAVVISDQRMPGMTGDELLALLSDLSDATRVMVTGYAELTAVIRAVNNGRIFAYVTKPWDNSELRMTVQKCVEHFDLIRKLARERQLLEDLMNNIPDAIYFKDHELKFQRVNRACASRVAVADVADAVGKRLVDLGVERELAESVERDEVRILRGERGAGNFLRTVDAPSGRRFFSTTVAPVRTPGGAVQGLVGISREVTEREETERTLRRVTHVRTMLGAVNAAIVHVKEREGLLRECCRIAVVEGGLSFAAVLQVNEQEGRVTSALSHGEDEVTEGLASAFSSPTAGAPFSAESVSRLREPFIVHDLDKHQESPLVQAIQARGGRGVGFFPLRSEGRVTGVLLLVTDQAGFFDSEEVRLLAELADNIAFALDHIEKSALLNFLAYYDELTNLPKRDLLMDRLHQLLPGHVERDGRVALLLIDVSRFRSVNDTLGRRAGDELLAQVSQRLSQVITKGETLARFDSNAFALILTAYEDAASLTSWLEKQVLSRLDEPFLLRDTELRIAFRMGVAVFPSDATEPDELVRNAEAALSHARTSGEHFRFYAPSMNARLAEKLSLETRLRRAIEEQQFVLYYQPKVDLRNGGVVGLEALIRWRDPERGLISPADFIPVLEETGLILDVGSWVLDSAAAQYAAWIDEGLSPPRIAANVSAIQLCQPGFVRSVEQAIEHHPTARHALDLEITESVLMDDFASNVAKLRTLQQQGLRVAIDDFGTGYSSLGYLSRLPIDTLKIDRSFVIRMAEDAQDMTIVTTIISLAHSLDLSVVAEGVETADQARLLRLVKCDQIQGYLIGKPQPAREVTAQFRTSKATWPPPAAE